MVGDNAHLNANSGPVSQGGIVALDTVGSQLSTGSGVSRGSTGDEDDDDPAGGSGPPSPDEEQSLD